MGDLLLLDEEAIPSVGTIRWEALELNPEPATSHQLTGARHGAVSRRVDHFWFLARGYSAAVARAEYGEFSNR